MNDTLTLRDIDDYVEALLAFLPTQSQIQMIEDYSSIIENNPQYQRIVRRKLRIARSHNVFDNVNIEELHLESESKFISIMDIIERKLEDYKIHVKNQLETTFTISRKVSFALTRGDSVDESIGSIFLYGIDRVSDYGDFFNAGFYCVVNQLDHIIWVGALMHVETGDIFDGV